MSENQIKTSKVRFASTSDQEKTKLLDDRNAKNTRRATKNNIKVLTDYLTEKQLPSLDQLTDDDLPEVLFNFYSNLRKVYGELYKLQLLKCIQARIN